MKIMTLNAHSHGEDISESIRDRNLDVLAECICRWQVDVIALQEVCQTQRADAVKKSGVHGFVPLGGTKMREDNYVLLLMKKLEEAGCRYYWTWDGIKSGYERYDEGLAVVSRFPITEAEEYVLSQTQDYGNWKTRKAVAAHVGCGAEGAWFVSAHMGWWGDTQEPFAGQMDRLQQKLSEKKGNIYLMGDFNSPADERNTGYDYVSGYGWLDLWKLAGNNGHAVTVPGKIDGWSAGAENGLCIDYIWSRHPVSVVSSRVVFSGEQEAVVSDHFGILAEIRETESIL